MGVACKIIERDGQKLALNENGNISPLYLEALELYKGDEERALNTWATSHLPEFTETLGINPEEAILQDVLTFMDTASFIDKSLSPAERIQVESFMVKNGFESLHELDGVLSKIFKSKGYFQFDVKKMVESGLWSAQDIPYAESKKRQIKSIVNKIAGELKTNDISVTPNDKATAKYKNSANKTIFGSSEIVDITEIDNEIRNRITDFRDKDEFYEKIKDIPFDEYVTKFYTNPTFANKELSKFKDLKRVPILSFVNGELSAENNATYTTLKNTLLANQDSLSIETDLEYLQEIPIRVWDNSQAAIKDVIKEVEQTAASLNIDVVGLNEYSNQREEVLGLLSSLNTLLKSPTEANIQTFAQAKDTLIPQTENNFVAEVLPESMLHLNIVRVDSSKTDGKLFQEHGLIKIGDNLYHKVRRGQQTELYDFLYNEVAAGRIEIPITSPLEDKPSVLRELSEFVNSRETGIISEFQEEISLNQLAFGHTSVTTALQSAEMSNLATITTNPDYLQTDFISDFYNYVLEEKLKNSELYRDVLSHFTINDRDISLKGTKTPKIEGIKYEKEFKDYAKLKRDNSLKIYTSAIHNGVNEDLLALNDPQSIGEYRGELAIDGEFAVTPPSLRTWIKFNTKLYRRVGENNKISVYQEIKTQPNSVYYTTNLNFKTDKKLVDNIMGRYPDGLEVQQLTYEQKQENLKKARMTDSLPITKYQIISDTTSPDLKFTQNLVEFIRQKGVQVITDSEQMQAELEDSNAMVAGEESLKNLLSNERARELSIAIEMRSKKYTEREIKIATGWEFDDITGKWKYELDTSNIQTKDIEYTLTNKTSDFTDGTYKTTVSAILDYPELFKTYPKLKDMKVVLYKTDSELKNYDQFTDDKNIYINLELYGTEENRFNLNNNLSDEGRKGVLHELQHNISTIEGFARGGNQATIRRQIENILKDVRSGNTSRDKFEGIYRGVLENLVGEESLRKVAENTPSDWLDLVSRVFYNNLVGEVEARNVEERMSMTVIEKRNSLLRDTEKLPASEQIFLPNFLQTPLGNVLGFEKNGIIYLDETQLNETTTLHELKHVYDVITDIKAAQGNETAQKIIAKREELFNNEAEAAMHFHEGAVGEGEVSPMIIGEKGAKEMVEINQLLDAAKKMDADGIHPTQIEKATGWFKEFDQWKYFSKEALETFNIQNETYNKLDVEQSLEDVIGADNILFTFYPQLKQTKVVFYEGREDILGSEQGERIMVNTRRSADTINGREYLGGLAGAGRGITREESIILTLAHETSHRIQTLEGTLRGGSTETIIREAQRITGEQRPQLGFLRDSIEKTIESTENNEELFILENALIVVNSRLIEDESNALKVYKSLYGEAEARSLEYAKSELTKGRDLSDVTFTELREKLLEAENLTAEGLIPIRGEGDIRSQLKDTIGLDLSSPLYAQRPSESRTQWKTRLLKEVEAYVVAPTTAEKLENLRKENPSLWQQITDYINMLTNWLKGQIGLSDYQGDIMSMTKEEYVNALGVSILKDEYTTLPSYQQLMDKYNSVQPFADGEIEIIYHHSEAQHEEVMNKIDECGS